MCSLYKKGKNQERRRGKIKERERGIQWFLVNLLLISVLNTALEMYIIATNVRSHNRCNAAVMAC